MHLSESRPCCHASIAIIISSTSSEFIILVILPITVVPFVIILVLMVSVAEIISSIESLSIMLIHSDNDFCNSGCFSTTCHRI